MLFRSGLDAEGSKIGDALWNGEDIDEATRARIVGLYRLRFAEMAAGLERFAGEPAYLILAMTAAQVLRVKPQNLVAGLPVRHLEAAS